MRRALLGFAVVFGVAVLAAGVPSLAADSRTETSGNSIGANAPVIFELNYTDQPTVEPATRAKPKRQRAPGRRDLSGLNVFCAQSGFLADMLGFADFRLGCAGDNEGPPSQSFSF